MECTVEEPESADRASSSSAQPHVVPAAPEPAEKAKRTKHTRVQKREKELYGLVTPVFLPLLDARDTPPPNLEQKKKQQQQQQQQAQQAQTQTQTQQTQTQQTQTPKQTPKQQTADNAPAPANPEQATPMEEAERSTETRKSRKEHTDMEGATAAETGKNTPHGEAPKKAKRPTTKKSALRQHTTTKPRRKRVSLVIDGQTVLPADTVLEPALTSPSSEATSASNSTTSLDDMIDPRLTKPEPHIHDQSHDAMHHSLPKPVSMNVHSPTKSLLDGPTSTLSPRTTQTPIFAFNPPSTAVHTFLDPSPTLHPDPITLEESSDETFHTYVGGLRGSGADDVDQAGSYGYPSSLGASYLESYMQSRPMRVRREAADKAGLDERETREMVERPDKEDEETAVGDVDMEIEEKAGEKEDADEEGDFMGEMEDFN
jgi:hypothetical protein